VAVGLYTDGVRGAVLLWIEFFCLSTHQTKVGSYLSDTEALISGVVQGSGIGPLMFLVYINELATVLEFADDVKLYQQQLCTCSAATASC